MRFVFASVVLVLASEALLPASFANADENFFAEIDVATPDPSAEKPWEMTGLLRQKLKYAWQSPENEALFARRSAGLSQVRTEVVGDAGGRSSDTLQWKLGAKLEIDALAWEAGAREFFTDDARWFWKDAYLDVSTEGGLWLRAGHQIFAWGNAEGLAVTDFLSPRDEREPGQAELRDVREQVPALMVSVPLAGWKLMPVFTWAAGRDRVAEGQEDFNFQARFAAPSGTRGIFVDFIDPQKNWEAALRAERYFNGGDIALVAAVVNDNEASELRADETGLALRQPRMWIAGGSANRVFGSWLLRGELARWRWDLETAERINGPHDQWRGMLGLEYSLGSTWRLTGEINVQRRDRESPAAVGNLLGDALDRERYGAVLRLRHSAVNERLVQQLWWARLVGDEGDIGRWELHWDWSDRLRLGAGVILYVAEGEQALSLYRHGDNANLSATWYF